MKAYMYANQLQLESSKKKIYDKNFQLLSLDL